MKIIASLFVILISPSACGGSQEEKTVEDEEFYKKFFEAVEREIKVIAAKD